MNISFVEGFSHNFDTSQIPNARGICVTDWDRLAESG